MRRVSGFTLVEVMVAVLVLALGLVGGLALQLQAMRTRHESALLSRAVGLAAGMAERIRANTAALPSYLALDYDAGAGASTAADAAVVADAASVARCAASDCDSSDIAALDIADLQAQVRRYFPAGRVRICHDTHMWAGGRLRWDCSGGPYAPVVIKIGWRGRNPDGTPLRKRDAPDVPGVAVAVAGGWL